MIAYLASDLVWASRIKAAADALSIPCRPVRNLDMLNARITDGGLRALIVDLEAPADLTSVLIHAAKAATNHPQHTTSGSSAAPTHNPLGSAPSPIHVLAFGPHVARDRLQAARDAGADDVLPRGAFAAHLDDILIRLAGAQH